MIDISAAINFRYLHNNRSSMCGLFVVGQESSLTFFLVLVRAKLL